MAAVMLSRLQLEKAPLIGLGICCCCLIVYLKPDAPGAGK